MNSAAPTSTVPFVRASRALAALPQTSVLPSCDRGDFVQRTRILVDKAGSIAQTLSIYNEPDDYRRTAWLAEAAALDERLTRIAALLEQLALEFPS